MTVFEFLHNDWWVVVILIIVISISIEDWIKAWRGKSERNEDETE